jgi:hypothetical protein
MYVPLKYCHWYSKLHGVITCYLIITAGRTAEFTWLTWITVWVKHGLYTTFWCGITLGKHSHVTARKRWDCNPWRWPFKSWNMLELRVLLTFRHLASCILGQAFRYSPENVLYIFNSTNIFHYLIFAWPCIIDINNIDNQLDATITAY